MSLEQIEESSESDLFHNVLWWSQPFLIGAVGIAGHRVVKQLSNALTPLPHIALTSCQIAYFIFSAKYSTSSLSSLEKVTDCCSCMQLTSKVFFIGLDLFGTTATIGAPLLCLLISQSALAFAVQSAIQFLLGEVLLYLEKKMLPHLQPLASRQRELNSHLLYWLKLPEKEQKEWNRRFQEAHLTPLPLLSDFTKEQLLLCQKTQMKEAILQKEELLPLNSKLIEKGLTLCPWSKDELEGLAFLHEAGALKKENLCCLHTYFTRRPSELYALDPDKQERFNASFTQMGLKSVSRTGITFADIGGYQEMKQELQEIVSRFKDPLSFQKMGAQTPKSVLLSGPSGVGKTQAAQALASELNIPLLHYSGSDFFSFIYERNALEDLFESARQKAPCILLIDRIDLFAKRNKHPSALELLNDGSSLDQLLIQLDRLKADEGILFIATTQRNEELNENLLSAGRLDRHLKLQLPSLNERLEILKLHGKNYALSPSCDLEAIAERSQGFSCAQLKQLLNEAAFFATSEKEIEITQETLLKAIKKTQKQAQQATALHPIAQKITLKDVAGIDYAIEEVEEVIHCLKNPKTFQALGARLPKGILLQGPPGTGKTLLAKAVAGETDFSFISTSGSEFVEMYVGVGAQRIRDLFEKAKKSAPCIIFIDEIDAVGGKRSQDRDGASKEHEQTLNQLLVEMDGFQSDERVIVMAATNRPDRLDKALLRPGRFDRHISLQFPNKEGRLEILKLYSHSYPLAPDSDLNRVAEESYGFSPAQLKNVLNEAAFIAAKKGQSTISEENILEAIIKVEYGKQPPLTLNSKQKRETAYHEAGHTVVALYLAPETLSKVTITPKGQSLGATHFLPDENRFNSTEKEMKAQLAILFGGRAGEQLFLGDISSGISDDLERATKLATQMVCKLGMGGKGFATSSKPTQEQQKAIEQLLKEAEALATSILSEHRACVEQIVERLVSTETLSKDELLAIKKETGGK